MTRAMSPPPTLTRRFRAAMRRYWVRTAFALPAAVISFLISSAPAFADLIIDGHRETWLLRSKRFGAW